MEHQPHTETGQPAGDRPVPEPVPPRIYVASLADYNSGRLVGRWLDADQDEEQLLGEAEGMLRSAAEPGAEEFAIHDYEGFAGLRLSEFESLATVARLARGFKEHGPAFGAWAQIVGTEQASAESSAEHHLGQWPDLAAYGETLAEDLGLVDYLQQIPRVLQPYVIFDHEALVRDMQLNGEVEIVEAEGGVVHVFQVPTS